MATRPTAVLILAAGFEERMQSGFPKVLHPVLGEPMIDHVLRAVESAGLAPVYMITGYLGQLVQAYVSGRGECLEQSEPRGSGHDAMQAEGKLADFAGDVIVINGDMPLLTADTLKMLLARRAERPGAGIVLTALARQATRLRPHRARPGRLGLEDRRRGGRQRRGTTNQRGQCRRLLFRCPPVFRGPQTNRRRHYAGRV